MAGLIKATCMVLVVAMLASTLPQGEAGITCGTVANKMVGCLPYLQKKGPLGSCCGGVKSLYGMATTAQDRQSVCSCLKSLAGGNKVDAGQAAGLPGQCGVSIPYKISPNINCATVH